MRARLAFAAAVGLAAFGCADPTLAPDATLRHDAFGDSVALLDSLSMGAEGAGATFDIIAPTTRLDSVGATLQLGSIAASGKDTVRNHRSVHWASSAPTVVGVDDDGLVTALDTGSATIRASYVWRGGNNVDSVLITVGAADSLDTPDTDDPSDTTDTEPDEPVVVGSAVKPQDTDAERPRVLLNTNMPARPGRVLQVDADGDLQAAIDSARQGDQVVLEAGATYVGNFRLRAKTGSGWITIRTSAEASLPDPGTRITPEAAPALARVVSPNGSPAIATDARAHHYRLVGLEVAALPGVPSNTGLVLFGSTGSPQTSLAEVPQWLVLDRSWVHGDDRMYLKRCVALNAASAAVIDSRLEACHGTLNDTQAIGGFNGPGPFKIVNNYLADASEVIMFGGGTPAIGGLVPSDIEIRRNHIRQTDVMHDWLVKNLVELKTAQRVLIAENVIEHVWADGQAGFALNLKSSGTCSACITRNVTVESNYIGDAVGGITMLGKDTGREREAMHHVTIRNNLFGGIRSRMLQILNGRHPLSYVTIEQNTGEARQAILVLSGSRKTTQLRVRYNAFGPSSYGVKGDGAPSGKATLSQYSAGTVFKPNVLTRVNPAAYPSGNIVVSALEDAPATTPGGVRLGAAQSANALMAQDVRVP